MKNEKANKTIKGIGSSELADFINRMLIKHKVTISHLRVMLKNHNLTANSIKVTQQSFVQLANILKLTEQERGKLSEITGCRRDYHNDEIYEFIIEKIKNKHDRKQLNARMVSERVGGSPSFIPRLKSGERRLTLTTALRLAEILKLTGDEQQRLFKLAWKALTENMPKGQKQFAVKHMWLRIQGDIGRFILDMLMPSGTETKSTDPNSIDAMYIEKTSSSEAHISVRFLHNCNGSDGTSVIKISKER